MKDISRKFAIIGCEHAHIAAFIEEMLAMGWECAGIFEPRNRKLAESISHRYHIPIVEDRLALLNDAVEIVGCAAINNEKIDIIELCEQHGKHIMLDKPAVTNSEDLVRLREVMERGRVHVGMLLTERYRPSIRRLKRLIDSGELGKIVNIAMRKPHRLQHENRPAWHFSKKQNGGIIFDLFIHDFDLLRWLTGSEIKAIDGYMAKTIFPEYPDFYDLSSLQVCLQNGVLAQLYADWHNPESSWTWGDCRIFVTGTKGVAELRLEGDPLISEEALLLQVSHNQKLTRVPIGEADEVRIARDFLNRLEGNQAAITHDDIYLASLATVEADRNVKIISYCGS
ncbi:Gfo/Idh/MocA family protein [Paenibacillus sp. Cedars]|uniref:Gfo/Idh/MocA family protein n=1 Tax=Paenibacillus sp. Cedars TaxID=1980674 RepID=UPI0011620020|nr:Gfo/Idh/MocA family oxidoreductase [Paenibacillus sp. Cedars]AWP27722.1 oxidoreductase [Paenibacillus sp. Cedars]